MNRQTSTGPRPTSATTIHIVVYEYPRRGSGFLRECSDTRRLRCNDPRPKIISVIRAGETPEVYYGANDPKIRQRVDRLRKQVEAGRPLSGGPLILGRDGELTTAPRTVAGRITQQDAALAWEIRGAFDPPSQFSLKEVELTLEQERAWLKKLTAGDRKTWLQMAKAGRMISRDPKPWRIVPLLHELHGNDIDGWPLWDRYGKDPRVVAVPFERDPYDRDLDEPWDLYRHAHNLVETEDEGGRRISRMRSAEERKTLCRQLLAMLQARCPSLPSSSGGKVLEVLGRRVSNRASSRAAFQTADALAAALAAAAIDRKNPGNLRRRIKPSN